MQERHSFKQTCCNCGDLLNQNSIMFCESINNKLNSMSIQTLEQSPSNQLDQLHKPLTLIANMNTNNSLSFSQTIEQNKNGFLQTKQAIFLSKQISDLPINSRKKKQPRMPPPHPISHHFAPPKDANTLVNSMKMIAFMLKQGNDKQKFIENKSRAVQQLRNKVRLLEETIKHQKQQYQFKLSNFNSRAQRLKTERRSISKRIKTEISEIKYKIHSIKKKQSIGQASSLDNKTFQNIKTRRRSSRVSTERSPPSKRIYIPLACTYQTIPPHITQQFHPYTLPMRRPNPQENNYFSSPKQFRRTVTQHVVPSSSNKSGNPYLIKTQSDKDDRSIKNSSKHSAHRNLFDILGQHIRIPQNANTIESLTVQKAEQSMSGSLLNLSRSKSVKKRQSYKPQTQSQRQNQNGSILDAETIKLFEDDYKNPPNKIKQSSMRSSMKLKSVDFRIGNMGDSVQSQYTETERPNQLLFKPKTNEQSQRESSNFALDSQLQVQSGNQLNEDIIDSIKLTSHSRIYKQKLAESKYIPFYDNPSRLVQNSEILELNLLAESNISRKRASNSKIIKKKMQSIEIDAAQLNGNARGRVK